MTSEESGIRESYFHLADEKAGNKLLYRIIHSLIPENGTPSLGSDLISSDNLFRFQSSVIRKLAQEESCIIIGRCADYVLRDADVRLLRVFVSAPEEQRIARKMEQEHLTQPQAARLLRKMDKQRRKYYETYTHHVWGDSTNYDLCIDTSTCTLDEAAARIADRFRAMA